MSWKRLEDFFKTSWRHVFQTSSKHVFRTSSRRLQRNNFLSSKTFLRRLPRRLCKTSSRRLCKTSSRRLGRRKIVILKAFWRRSENMSWRRLQDQQMFAGNVLKNVSAIYLTYNISVICWNSHEAKTCWKCIHLFKLDETFIDYMLSSDYHTFQDILHLIYFH